MNRIIAVAAALALALIAVIATTAEAGVVPAKRHPPTVQNRSANPLFTHPFSPFRMLRRGDIMPNGLPEQQDCGRHRSRISRSKCEARQQEQQRNEQKKQD